jgi:hypothetical protein
MSSQSILEKHRKEALSLHDLGKRFESFFQGYEEVIMKNKNQPLHNLHNIKNYGKDGS